MFIFQPALITNWIRLVLWWDDHKWQLLCIVGPPNLSSKRGPPRGAMFDLQKFQLSVNHSRIHSNIKTNWWKLQFVQSLFKLLINNRSYLINWLKFWTYKSCCLLFCVVTRLTCQHSWHWPTKTSKILVFRRSAHAARCLLQLPVSFFPVI